MCQVFKVSRAGYYNFIKGIPSKRSIENQQLAIEIQDAFVRNKKTYGSPRITRELHKKNIKISSVRVAKLMRKAGLRSIVKKKFKVTTDSAHKFSVPDNILDRNFKPGTLGAVWVSDITYIRTQQGWFVSDQTRLKKSAKAYQRIMHILSRPAGDFYACSILPKNDG